MIENQALRPIADAFKKKYPFMGVDYWRGDSRALVQKAHTERRAGRVTGDILESTGGAEALIKAGAIDPSYLFHRGLSHRTISIPRACGSPPVSTISAWPTTPAR